MLHFTFVTSIIIISLLMVKKKKSGERSQSLATNHTATSDYVMIQTNIIGIKAFFLYFTDFPLRET